ncbi:MAG: helix-turn-helix domain-containing protein [Halorientalis sp.]
MSLFVEYRASGPHIHITEAAAAVSEMQVTVEQWRLKPGDRLTLFLLAEGRRFEAFETALANVSNVVTTETITAADAYRLYRVELVSKIEHVPEYSTIKGFVRHVRVEPEGLYVTGYVKDRAEIDRLQTFAAAKGVDVLVVRLREATGRATERLLTDEQFTALVTAYEMGYFDVPRAATQQEVASRLDIAPTSLSERLTRAQHRLVEGHLVDEPSMQVRA